jgi:hypothetical protein
MVDLPAPDGPTMATILPAGTSKSRPFRIGRAGSYAKCTFSKRTRPSLTTSGLASGASVISGSRLSNSNMASMSISPCFNSR